MAKVLIVEDDEVIGRGISGHLANAGFEPAVTAVPSATSAIAVNSAAFLIRLSPC